jgi:predicted amidohydrolase
LQQAAGMSHFRGDFLAHPPFPVAERNAALNHSTMSTSLSTTPPRLPHAHLVQADIAWEDKDANFRKTDALLAHAPVVPGDLIVLAELFDTGFSFNLPATADTDGRTLAYLRDLARRTGAIAHGARTVIGPDGRGRNRATVCAPSGELLCEYDKVHPFTFGKESEHFSGGPGVTTYDWTREDGAPVARVCPAICYDLRFPELFRVGLLRGTELYAIGANWPAPRQAHRIALSIARAIENQAYVLSVNRCGRDPTLEYAGGTLAVSPKGDVLAQLGDAEGVLSVPIDPALIASWRATFPAWRDHRLIGPSTG